MPSVVEFFIIVNIFKLSILFYNLSIKLGIGLNIGKLVEIR